jgi:hypothetical protein
VLVRFIEELDAQLPFGIVARLLFEQWRVHEFVLELFVELEQRLQLNPPLGRPRRVDRAEDLF